MPESPRARTRPTSCLTAGFSLDYDSMKAPVSATVSMILELVLERIAFERRVSHVDVVKHNPFHRASKGSFSFRFFPLE